MVRDFIARDPLRPIRDAALTQWRAATGPALGVLHVLHGHGGGTEHHARALVDATRGRCRHFLAIAGNCSWQIEEHLDDGGVRSYAFAREDGEPLAALLGGLCATFRIGLFHLHNISGCREGLFEALSSLGVPWGYTVHDLSFACPLITLHGRNGLYCGGETDPVACQACLAAQPGFADVDVTAWRAGHAAIVRGASFLIAPSQWAAGMLERYFPGARIDVIPHGPPGSWARDTRPAGEAPDRRRPQPLSAVLLPDDGIPTVAVIGAVGPDKGARRLERLVELARAHGGSPRFVVIGYLDVERGPWQSPDAVLTVHGVYVPRDLPRLLAHYRVALVAYPSAGPETFSFTLTETWETGRPAVVPPFGALAERVGDSGAGFVLTDDEWKSEPRMYERIVALLADRQALRSAGDAALRVRHSTQESMADRTLAHYVGVARAVRATVVPLAPARVRDALGYETWWPPEPPTAAETDEPVSAAANEPNPANCVRVPARAGLVSRLGSTSVGRGLVRLLPASVVVKLRSRWS
jgi:glycosyltransferase involved in cell wall biosynthesis